MLYEKKRKKRKNLLRPKETEFPNCVEKKRNFQFGQFSVKSTFDGMVGFTDLAEILHTCYILQKNEILKISDLKIQNGGRGAPFKFHSYFTFFRYPTRFSSAAS